MKKLGGGITRPAISGNHGLRGLGGIAFLWRGWGCYTRRGDLVIGSEIYSHIHYATIIAKFLTLIPHVSSEIVQAFKRRGIYSSHNRYQRYIHIVYLRFYVFILTEYHNRTFFHSICIVVPNIWKPKRSDTSLMFVARNFFFDFPRTRRSAIFFSGQSYKTFIQ